MRLLWDNGLRRQEIVNLNVRDFNAKEKTLAILGKGKGSQKEILDLSERTTDAIAGWIKVSKKKRGNDPLFKVSIIGYMGIFGKIISILLFIVISMLMLIIFTFF